MTVKATIAATVQSSIGNVAAGSAFATFTSAGAGGAGLIAVNGAAQACRAAIAAGSGVLAWVKANWSSEQVREGAQGQLDIAAEGVGTAQDVSLPTECEY